MSDSVHVAFSKLGGIPHWESTPSGSERMPSAPGSCCRRAPRDAAGVSVLTPVDAVSLAPLDTPAVPSFHRIVGAPPEVQLSVYVDITTPPIWDGDTGTMVDLDLDVAQHIDGRILVLDEDEFAEHQISFGYPADLIALARASCDEVLLAMQTGAEPYLSVGWTWLLGTC